MLLVVPFVIQRFTFTKGTFEIEKEKGTLHQANTYLRVLIKYVNKTLKSMQFLCYNEVAY